MMRVPCHKSMHVVHWTIHCVCNYSHYSAGNGNLQQQMWTPPRTCATSADDLHSALELRWQCVSCKELLRQFLPAHKAHQRRILAQQRLNKLPGALEKPGGIHKQHLPHSGRQQQHQSTSGAADSNTMSATATAFKALGTNHACPESQEDSKAPAPCQNRLHQGT